MNRKAHCNLDVFSKLMNGMDFIPEPQKHVEVASLSPDQQVDAFAADVWAGQDEKQQKELYAKLLRDSTSQAGYVHKKERRLMRGPALPHAYALIGSMPVNLRAGQPLVIDRELTIPINANACQVKFFGNVSFPYGYPAYGERGELAAEYLLEYTDGAVERISLHNGIELTTALGTIGPSRIRPVASGVTFAARYSYDLNWEHYCLNLFETAANPERELSQVRVRILDSKYVLLLYGITLGKPKGFKI